jgi:Zinc knuckle
VKSRRKVFLLSYYLTGKAYDFYTQKVAIDEERWTVPAFYKELFNYCFPVDYRMQLRKTLARCHQNDKTVAEYTHELQELFNMIGNIPKQDQVIKFWNGARPAIQKELWKNKLNPELSSWRKVVEQAEIIEIADNVAERRDRRSGQSSQSTGATAGTGKNKSQQTDTSGSVRAVAFGSRHHSQGKRQDKSHTRSTEQASKRGATNTRENTPADKGKSRSGSAPANPPQQHKSQQKTKQLTDSERAEYRAAGKCFKCGTVGHMSRNCPDNTVVQSQGRGPPGASTFNLEPVPETMSEDGVEVLDSLPLGAVFIGDEEPEARELTAAHDPDIEWRYDYPYWSNPGIHARRKLGDCYAMVADAILTTQQPYPGDELFATENLRPELRFIITKQQGTGDYWIRDQLTHSREIIARSLLQNPKFNISRWYAKKRQQAKNLPGELAYDFPIGLAVSIVATKLLTDGIPSAYPSTNPDLDPEDRFIVFPSQCHQGNLQWTVRDQDLGLNVPISITQLENPRFDLVEWYHQHLNQVPERGIFEYQYLRHYPQSQNVKDSDMEDLDVEFEYPEEQELHNEGDLPALIPLSESDDDDDDEEDVTTSEDFERSSTVVQDLVSI